MALYGHMNVKGKVALVGSFLLTAFEDEAKARNETFTQAPGNFELTPEVGEFLGYAFLKWSRGKKKERKEQKEKAVFEVQKEEALKSTEEFKKLKKSIEGTGGSNIKAVSKRKILIETFNMQNRKNVETYIKKHAERHGFNLLQIFVDKKLVVNVNPRTSPPPPEVNKRSKRAQKSLENVPAPVATTSKSNPPPTDAEESTLAENSTTKNLPAAGTSKSSLSAPVAATSKSNPPPIDAEESTLAENPTKRNLPAAGTSKSSLSVKRKIQVEAEEAKRVRTSISDGASTNAKRKTINETETLPEPKRLREDSDLNSVFPLPSASSAEAPFPVLQIDRRDFISEDSESEEERLVIDLGASSVEPENDKRESKLRSLTEAIKRKSHEVSLLSSERPENYDEIRVKIQEEVTVLQEEMNLLGGRKRRKIIKN